MEKLKSFTKSKEKEHFMEVSRGRLKPLRNIIGRSLKNALVFF